MILSLEWTRAILLKDAARENLIYSLPFEKAPNDTIFATPAGVFRAAGDEHLELRRHDVQPLALVLADPVQLALAAGAGPVVDIDDDLDPWQMREPRLVRRFSARAARSVGTD